MSTGQIIAFVLVALVPALYLGRWFLLRTMKVYSAQDVAELVKQPGSVLLLDVRTTAERQRGSIKGSVHIPLHELGHRSKELEKHKNAEVICYCQSGNRSLMAAARLKKLGFKVANLRGGIGEWNSRGLG